MVKEGVRVLRVVAQIELRTAEKSLVLVNATDDALNKYFGEGRVTIISFEEVEYKEVK